MGRIWDMYGISGKPKATSIGFGSDIGVILPDNNRLLNKASSAF